MAVAHSTQRLKVALPPQLAARHSRYRTLQLAARHSPHAARRTPLATAARRSRRRRSSQLATRHRLLRRRLAAARRRRRRLRLQTGVSGVYAVRGCVSFFFSIANHREPCDSAESEEPPNSAYEKNIPFHRTTTFRFHTNQTEKYGKADQLYSSRFLNQTHPYSHLSATQVQ